MVAVAITFDGTRLNDSDDNSDWGNFQPGTGGAPSSEGANAYQISSGAAANTGVVGRQSQSTTSRRGVDFNDPGTAVDFTNIANRLFYLKGYVTDFSDVNATFGVEFAMGSADTDLYHSYNVAGSNAALSVYSAYPAQGGYIITCIDPTIDTWAETADVGGAFDQTAVEWYAFGAQMIAGNSKSENVAFDSLDYGTGLTMLNGTGGDDPGKYTDYVIADQDDLDKRWGAAIGGGDNAILRGVMTIGASGTATEFNDVTSVVTFPDGYHSRALFGVDMNIENASSILVDGALLIGEGTRNGLDVNDTRPDYTVIGTAGAFTFNGQMRNFRDVTFTSVCDIVDADFECMLLVQNSANISSSTIRTNALISIACLQDPIFGTSTDLFDCTFVQTGAGHAIELDGVDTTYEFNDLFFIGYGADTTDDAALDVTAISGTTTINVNGGGAPTFKTAGATVVIANAVGVSTTGVTEGAAVKVIANETVGTITTGDVLSELLADASGTAAFSIDYEGAFDPSGLDVIVRARQQGLANFALSEDNTVFVDETTESNSSSTNDMNLLVDTSPVAGQDWFYFGHAEQFFQIKLDIGTAMAGGALLDFEYWDGGGWTNLGSVVDGTSNYTNTGENTISWADPGDWATTSVDSKGPVYYVRIGYLSGTVSTAPLGRKVKLDVTRYLPFVQNNVITDSGLAVTASWAEDSIAIF